MRKKYKNILAGIKYLKVYKYYKYNAYVCMWSTTISTH